MHKPIESQRTDGRGHWPAGKRRNEDSGDWSAIRMAVSALIDNHYRVGVRSYRAVADAIGISDRSVRKHLSGTVRPSPELQESYAAWAKEQRRTLGKSEFRPASQAAIAAGDAGGSSARTASMASGNAERRPSDRR